MHLCGPLNRLVWLALAGAALAGCGRGDAVPHADLSARRELHSASAAPRPIELPATVRPIVVEALRPGELATLPSIAAAYERTDAGSPHGPPRITGLSIPPRSGPAILEPAASGVTAQPAGKGEPQPWEMESKGGQVAENKENRGSSAVGGSSRSTSSLSSATTPTTDSHVPELAARPTFQFPPVCEPAAQSPASTPYGGPPIAPIASSGETAARTLPATAPSWDELRPPPQRSPFLPAADYRASPRPHDAIALRPALEQAGQQSDRALAMAQRGMLYAARDELMGSLQLVAQALDVDAGSGRHTTALVAALTALEEARDFFAPASHSAAVDVAAIAGSHKTPVLQPTAVAVSPLAAQQQYLAYAQQQLAIAVAGAPTASQTLYRLGKLESTIAAQDDRRAPLHVPQAMVFHQAALDVDGGNYLAANELGVLLARYGQLAEARRLLVHSVSLRPHAEGWHNLAVVHRRLGEEDLARRAEYEHQLAVKERPEKGAADKLVQWVDRQSFAASGEQRPAAPTTTAASPARLSLQRR